MNGGNRALAGLVLGGVALLFVFLGGAPLSALLGAVGAVLGWQALRGGEGKALSLAALGLNGLAAALGLLASVLGGLIGWLFK